MAYINKIQGRDIEPMSPSLNNKGGIYANTVNNISNMKEVVVGSDGKGYTFSNKNYTAIYDDNTHQLSFNPSDYPGIMAGDHIEEEVATNLYNIYKVFFVGANSMNAELIHKGYVKVEQSLITESETDQLYAIDSIVFTRNGKCYRCQNVTNNGDDPLIYTYTWQEVRTGNKNFDAVYDDGILSRDRDDYPGIKQNDLIFEWLANNYYRIYKVMNDSSTLLLDIVGERISVSQNLITTNTGNKLYAPDSIVVTSDGKMYRCASVTDDGQIPTTYTYTWAEIRPDNRCYPAVISSGNISYNPSDYPGIKYGDLAYSVSNNKVTFWAQVMPPDSVVYWTKQEVNDRHVYNETTAPPASVSVGSELYTKGQIGDTWVATVTVNNVTTVDVYLLTGITQVEITKNLSWSNLTSGGGSGLPPAALSDEGKVLTVDSNGDAVWAEPVVDYSDIMMEILGILPPDQNDYSNIVQSIVGNYEEEDE